MKTYWMRVCRSTKYPGVIAHSFAIDHYLDVDKGADEFSKKLIHFYKYRNDIDFFSSELIEIFKTYFEKDRDKLNFDIVTLMPTHEKNGINPNMLHLVEQFSAAINIPYGQIGIRNKTTKKQHEISNFNERYENVQDSISIVGEVKDKNILVLDNVVITGITLVSFVDALKRKGAKNVVCLALGLSRKEKDKDYYLNETMGALELMAKFRSPKISKEEREAYKKQKDGGYA